MFSVAVFRGVERKYFVVFVDENVDADCLAQGFKFWCVREFEREIESGDVQFAKVLSIVVQLICVLIYSVYMRENTRGSRNLP